jgi:hypothetical protein
MFFRRTGVLSSNALPRDLEWDILVLDEPIDSGHGSSLALGWRESRNV